MPEFNQPGDEHVTERPEIEVTVNRERPLPPGTYVFGLRVVDNDDNVSDLATTKVVVVDPGPSAVIDGPEQVGFGERFVLSGERSSDIEPGRIVRYLWTLVEVDR
jgi:hypothetical protein